MKIALSAALIALLGLAACATAEPGAQVAAAAPAAAGEPQPVAQLETNDDVVCETIRRPGSMLGERVCESRAYREQRLRDSQEGHRRSTTSASNPFSPAERGGGT